ncbi:Nucleolar protein 9 [Escovopsis weberi]|uniref:Nucleolar protein 9 n=1 Tax=Escovopsis weberi TaxID=150374 RepID=A0A0M9VSX2_ESCWE|nr:Nucleolar protein 9 [Escovopsis weberi]
MPKPRTKRSHIREERKRKRLEEEDSSHYDKKRQRQVDGENNGQGHGNNYGYQDEQYGGGGGVGDGDGGFPLAEKEFFGMLADEEQEYFRRADEMLELNQFPSREERDVFLQSVFHEARGKELKLASSQSCSRLMERLIQLSGTAQKKHLFEAFAGHFLSLVQHRFASHCCEALFLRSAGVVTQELAGFVVDTKGSKKAESSIFEEQQDQQQQEPEQSMESLFLATLDELEGGLGYLLTDRFASHTLRVLLMVLSGRPLEDASARTLMKSRKKENVSVVGSAAADEQNQGARAVPASFLMAAGKIIRDSTAGMDATALRVLAKHPIGNPTLQLLLELDLTLNKGEKKKTKKKDTENTEEGKEEGGLLSQLLPGAPQSLADPTSEASEFINGMVYDQIGSRLIETLVAHAPGKIFKALNQHTFLPRIQGYVRNDISCYPAIKVLSRLSKEDLVGAVGQIAPTVPQLVAKARYNVLRTLFERCAARGAGTEIKKLMRGLKEGCGPRPVDLVTTLCGLSAADDDDENDDDDDDDDDEKKEEKEKKKKSKDVAQLTRNEYAIRSHGAQLLTSLLSIPGPCKAVHESLAALPAAQLARLATASMPSVTLLTRALATPSANAAFQKTVVDALTPRVAELAASQFGHNLVVAVAEIPSRGRDRSVPPHKKDAVMAGLAAHEAALRESWMGRSVWRAWRGDVWKTRRGDWKAWMRELDEQAPAAAPSGANGQPRREKREKERRRTAMEDEGQAQAQEDVEMEDDAGADGPREEEKKPEAPLDEAKRADGEGEGEGEQDEKKKKKKRRRKQKDKEDEAGQEDTEMKDD